ncbi:MAG: Rieske 2Fe-2S domain-containing protein [Gammaproteobacteria bacterium]|jgi:3-phenylpropionate/trans-cinnamate dioxygenase ferredoxin subunit
MPPPYQPIARASDIPRKQVRSFAIGVERVLIAHTPEGFFAVQDGCTHAETRLSHGRLKHCRIICPLHGASFDVRDGSVLRGPATTPLRSYPLRIVDDTLEVDIA